MDINDFTNKLGNGTISNDELEDFGNFIKSITKNSQNTSKTHSSTTHTVTTIINNNGKISKKTIVKNNNPDCFNDNFINNNFFDKTNNNTQKTKICSYCTTINDYKNKRCESCGAPFTQNISHE